MSKNNISFILHKPQLSENIGACARAIKNFNFKKLVLINPKPTFPNDKILATSVGAKDIINQSKKYDNLEKALGKIDILIATSARFRNKNIKHINLDDLKKINFKKKIGFLFGSEASGLSNNEVSYANYTLQIPTNPGFGSLNLAMAVNIICYEWFINFHKKVSTKIKKNIVLADKEKLKKFKKFLIDNIHETGFFKNKDFEKLETNVKNIFSKSLLTNKELLILYGIIKSLKNYEINNWHIKKHK